MADTWDWIVCPHESMRTQLLVRKIKAKRQTGYRNLWNGLVFDDRVARPMILPEAIRQLALIQKDDVNLSEQFSKFGSRPDLRLFPELASLDSREVGVVPDWASMDVPRLRELRSARAASVALDRLSERAALVVTDLRLTSERGSGVVFLAPGSVWPTKMWPAEGYAESARELMKVGFRVVLMGAPAERELCAEISKLAPGTESITGRTGLAESAEVLAFADLLICNDSGSMHMAAACGVPNVAVFGPTTLELGYRPWQSAVQKNLRCRPCGKHGAKTCPIGTHECMRSIPAGEVLHEAGELLKSKRLDY